jgi:hypothetical protein
MTLLGEDGKQSLEIVTLLHLAHLHVTGSKRRVFVMFDEIIARY